MAFPHLVNCLLLSYGPFFAAYQSKNMAEYRAYRVCLVSMFFYCITQSVKMVIQAPLVGVLLPQSDMDYSIINEINKNIFNIIDVVALLFFLKHSISQLKGANLIRVLAVAIGWSWGETTLTHFFYLCRNATQDEFNQKYLIRSTTSTLGFIENLCLIAVLVALQKNVYSRKSFTHFTNYFYYLIVIVKIVLIPLILRISLQGDSDTMVDIYETTSVLINKSVLTLILFIITKITQVL